MQVAGRKNDSSEDCCKCHHWFVESLHLHITSPSPDPGPRFQMMGKNVLALYPTDIRSSEPHYFRRVWPASLLEQSGKAARVCHIFAGTTPCAGAGFAHEGVLQSAVYDAKSFTPDNLQSLPTQNCSTHSCRHPSPTYIAMAMRIAVSSHCCVGVRQVKM